MRKLFTPEEIEDICGRYASGESVAVLAEKYRVHRSVIERRLIGHGIAIRTNGALTLSRDKRRYWLTDKGLAVASSLA